MSRDRSLTRNERLAQIGTLTASVAHEINNPAAFVLTNHGLMLEHLEELEQALTAPEIDRDAALGAIAEMTEMCRDNRIGIRRIAGIARELRNHARSETAGSGSVEANQTTQVNDSVGTAVKMVRNRVRHDAELCTSFTRLPEVLVDGQQLAQVVMNLIVNAAQAVREAGIVDGRITVSTVLRGEHVGIVVSDNGCGMPPEVRARIFEPFFTTKPLDEGTGLGLAISADIIRKHGGRIDCESVVGTGTTFEVVLPAAPSPSVRSANASVHPPPSSRASRILVVDDDLRVARSVKRALDPPHRVVIAHGGREAVDVLHADPLFDVVICDIMMPGFDGPRVYEAACALSEDLGRRFIFMTGGAFNATARAFLRTTESTVCNKPIGLDDLRAHVDRALIALRSCTAA